MMTLNLEYSFLNLQNAGIIVEAIVSCATICLLKPRVKNSNTSSAWFYPTYSDTENEDQRDPTDARVSWLSAHSRNAVILGS